MSSPDGASKVSRWSVLTCALLSLGLLTQLALLFEIRSHVGALQLWFGVGSEVAASRGEHKSSSDGKASAELQHLREKADLMEEQLQAARESPLQARLRSLEEELRLLRESDATRRALPYLEFPPGTVNVKINVGPNVEPLISCDEGSDTVCILIELAGEPSTYLRELYWGRNNTMVFHLGLASHRGLVKFPLLNTKGMSTSLNKPSYAARWNIVHGYDFAGVLTLADVLDSIDPKFTIAVLVTDMQGFDFQAVKSAGDRLQRVRVVMCEAYKDGHATYAGVTNAIDGDWTPYMAALGFTKAGCADGFHDANAWELNCEFDNDRFPR